MARGGSTGSTGGSPAGGPTVADLGEIGLVERITARAAAASGPGPEVGPGDDAAVIAAPDGRIVVTTDLLVEGRHFRRDWSQPGDIGHRAVAQNLADIAAMGARPTAFVLGLGLPADTETSWVDDLVAAACDELAAAGARLVGGDVVRADAVTISGTALGDLEGRAPVVRSGARPGDVVAIAGRLGWAAAGLAVLSRGFRSPRVLVDAHRRPAPPYSAGVDAAVAGAHAMLDVSDGLLLDAGRMAAASGVSIDIRSAALPIADPLADAAAAYNLDPLVWVLTGGEDHALLGAFAADAVPAGFTVIGSVSDRGDAGPGGTSAAGGPVTVDGRPSDLAPGFDHFRDARG